MSASEAHRIFTVYERPEDYPDGYVVRGWTVFDGDPLPVPDSIAQRFKDLKAARRSIPSGLHRVERARSDDPTICEVWL